MSRAASSRGAGLLVLLLGAAVFLNYVDRGAIGIAAPGMTGDLHLSPKEFGVILSAFFWVYAPVQLFVGWLVDRFNIYRLIAAGVLLWATSTLLMGIAGGFWSLLILRIMLGAGETIAFPGASRFITRHVADERRGMANAALALGIALGPAAGTLAGGMILASHGWRAIFIAFGVVTLLWLIPWQLAPRPEEPAEANSNEAGVPVRALVNRWPLWAMSVAHIASNYVFYFILGWLPLFLTKSRGLPIPEMTRLATLGYVAQAIAAFGFGWLSDRWTRGGGSEAAIRRAMMIAGQLLAAIAVLGLAYADTPAEIGALSLNTYAIAQMFAGPRAAGTWVGIQNAIGNLSGIFGPIATGFIVADAGYNVAFVVTAAVAAAGALWWVVAVPKIEPVKID